MLPLTANTMAKVPPTRFNLVTQLIGAFINLMLYTLELVAAYVYFSSPRSKRDRKIVVYAVIFCLLVDTVGTFATCAVIFTFTIIFWGNDLSASRSHWTLTLWFIANAIVQFVVQGFMVYRYFRLSSNYIVSIPIVLLMLAIVPWRKSLSYDSFNLSGREEIDRLKDLPAVVVALSGAVAADTAISLALIWKLHQTRTFTKDIQRLITRISVLAIMTGCATSTVAIATLISYLAYPLSALATCFSFFLGRVYSLTMLFSLIARDKLAGDPWAHIDLNGEILPSLPSLTSQSSSPPTSTTLQFTNMEMPTFVRDESSTVPA
ncbi:hypothetical protein BDZ97DRAFT_1836886 [Flammula alnicola]|nr:hypothetical protein BDZ97DRAFT_1836886 [Flammula alnicola]